MDQYDHDLHPLATVGEDAEKQDDARTAYSIKKLNRRLNMFTNDELKQIVVLPKGARLHDNATYIDLKEAEPKEFTARPGMEVGSEEFYVPKSEVDYVLWNRLIGVDNPERLDQADEP